MFVAELFEAKAQKTVVIISGGFHPFHPGHLSMYTGAVRAFPGADVYVVATDDQSERPFPFAIKKQLAVIAGVPADAFVQVKSPFAPREVTGRYDPQTTTLVFVRSEKDRNESPRPGGVKKNGEPSYLQPLTKNPEPMSQHGYMAYLPTIEFKAGPAGMTSATQIRNAWPQVDAQTKSAIVADLYPRIAGNAKLIQRVTGILDQVLGGAVNETLKKVKGKWALVSKTTGRPLQYYHGSGHPSKEWVSKVERRVHSFSEDQITTEEASGVIATKAQARDPRYSMSLTQDVRPGQIQKNLKAFKLAEKAKK
jgi:hypothetical protein